MKTDRSVPVRQAYLCGQAKRQGHWAVRCLKQWVQISITNWESGVWDQSPLDLSTQSSFLIADVGGDRVCGPVDEAHLAHNVDGDRVCGPVDEAHLALTFLVTPHFHLFIFVHIPLHS
ncbi:hypothetical protein BLNAU_4741 [Blattamonas nauphoetae]|uniref:Uncharacterized protein n=1 Tax=Blattamonas nauphoetae TaxID=2049346 RepID=A0ABQ9Y920_9EUKA|nr:hypothetical protein BLNAU_4741 [Blattamonas nauphoetae]